MRHPKRVSWSRSAAMAALLAAVVLAPAAALADEGSRSASRERGSSSAGRTAVPRGSAPSTPSTRSTPASPSARSSGRGAEAAGESARIPDDSRGERRERAEDRRRHRDGGGFHGGFYSPGWYGYGHGGYWGSVFWGPYAWPWYYPYGYGSYGGPYGGGYGSYGGHYGRRASEYDLGALDLDVSPAKTEAYLDGQYIGRVDAYDGFPQYLWLEEGTYDLVLYKDGYQTIARQITVRPGVVVQVDHELERGESVRPENLATKTHERRDTRLRYERLARESAGERDDDEDENEADDAADAAERDDDDGRDSDREGGSVEMGDDVSIGERVIVGGKEVRADVRAEPGRVRLDVEPQDASVYLDGRFLGTGAELARLHSGLLVDRGAHRLAVVRPGYRQRDLSFDIDSGEDLEFDVELEPGG